MGHPIESALIDALRVMGKRCGDATVALNIAAPPCSDCKWWKPSLDLKAADYDFGVSMCAAPDTKDQEKDFSCWEKKP